MAKQLSKGPLGQLIWTQETNFRQIYQFCQNRHSFYVDPFCKKHGNICQTLVNSRQICYLHQVLYFWTHLVLTKNPATDTPTVLGNFSQRLSTVFQALTEARLKEKKIGFFYWVGKKNLPSFHFATLLLPFCSRQETRVTDSFPFTYRITTVELSLSSHLSLVAGTLY